jgi:DNA-binding SARP family transcriptional activator
MQDSAPSNLRLLGGFELRAGDESVDVPASGRRLMGFLALQVRAPGRRAAARRTLDRGYVAGVLWPETTDAKAAASLRTTIWRLHALRVETVLATPATVALAPTLRVDTMTLQATADALATHDPDFDVHGVAPEQLAGELMPELWDSWLVLERERLRQISLHTLEQLSERLTEHGDHARAVLAALAAVELEPLRETANRRLVTAHLAEGNVAEAIRHYQRYATLLASELGITPHPSFTEMLEPALLRRQTRPHPRDRRTVTAR